MKNTQKRKLFLGILCFFLFSFLFSSTSLNGNAYIKKFGIELFVSFAFAGYSLTGLFEKSLFILNLTITDLLVILLLLIYSGFLIFFKYSLLQHCLVYYYGMFYFISVLGIPNLTDEDYIYLKNEFLIFVPIVIVLHVIILILQQGNMFPALHSYFNTGSTFGNPDMLGAYVAILLPFCFIQKKDRTIIGYIASLAGILSLIFIQARSALLSVILSGIFWWASDRHIKIRQILISISFFTLVSVLLILWHPESVYGRFFVWFMSLKMFVEKPLGWGLYAFEKYYPEFQASYLAINHNLYDFIRPDIVHSPFNEFLNVGVTIGIIGLILFFTLLFWVIHSALKAKSFLIYPLFIFSIISFVYFPFKIVPIVALIIPMVATISSRSGIVYQKQLSLSSSRIFFLTMFMISMILSLNAIFNYRDQKIWEKAVLYMNTVDKLSESDKLFSDLYPRMNENGRFLITYATLKYKQGAPLDALELLEEAENYFCDITLSLKLAKLYEELGEYQKAEDHYTLAENIAPDRFFASYEKVLFFINIGEYEKAYLLSKKILSIPIKETSYADPIIIKSRLRKLVNEYELTK